MPELPEVETVVRSIRPDLVGQIIEGVWLDWERALKTPAPVAFVARIRNQTIQAVNRRAKYIVIELSDDYLLLHLKMSGRLYVVAQDAQHESDKWVHFRFQLGNASELRFSDARKFGTVHLTSEPETILGRLGPEPLNADFTLADFAERLRQRRGAIKPLLLNQAFLAGIGNIYADEALHQAHIAPLRTAESLSAEETEALFGAIRGVLEKGIERQGASINWYRQPDGRSGSMQDDFWAYGRDGQNCRTCGGVIQKRVVGQRGTHFCPSCQK